MSVNRLTDIDNNKNYIKLTIYKIIYYYRKFYNNKNIIIVYIKNLFRNNLIRGYSSCND